jgi:hypothetical protein
MKNLVEVQNVKISMMREIIFLIVISILNDLEILMKGGEKQESQL